MAKNIIFILLLSLSALQCLEKRTYKDQGIIFIIDRDDQDYYATIANPGKPTAVINNLDAALEYGTNAVIVVSTSVVQALFLYWSKTHPEKLSLFSSWEIRELEDFCILSLARKNILEIDLQLASIPKKNINDIMAINLKKYIYNAFFYKNIQSILSQLFRPASDIRWMVYLVGHGEKDQYIAGLSLPEFRDFLDFFAKKVSTKIFIYNSCYAGGENKVYAFKDTQQQAQKTYSFPIIVTSSTDTFTFSPSRYNPLRFDELFNDLSKTTSSIPDYYQILKDANALSHITNFPQIRLPETDYFSIAALNSIKNNADYMIISRVLGQTRKKDLTINDSVRIVFIYSPEIPFPLRIPLTTHIQRFVWMADADTYHFSELDASVHFIGLCKFFAPLSDIKPITCIFDKLDLWNIQLTNATLTMSKPLFSLFSNKFNFDLVGKNLKNGKTVKLHAETTDDVSYETMVNIVNYQETQS